MRNPFRKSVMVASRINEQPIIAGCVLFAGIFAGVTAMVKAGAEYDRIVPAAAEKIEITRATADALRGEDDD